MTGTLVADWIRVQYGPRTVGRVPDDELAELAERNGFPSVGQRLDGGETQEAATAYLVGVGFTPDDEMGPYFYRDDEGRWLYSYIHALAEGRVTG